MVKNNFFFYSNEVRLQEFWDKCGSIDREVMQMVGISPLDAVTIRSDASTDFAADVISNKFLDYFDMIIDSSYCFFYLH